MLPPLPLPILPALPPDVAPAPEPAVPPAPPEPRARRCSGSAGARSARATALSKSSGRDQTNSKYRNLNRFR